MRIGIFSDTYPPFINGVSTSIRMLEDELRKKGHTVYIVTVNSESMKYKQEGQVLRIPGVPTGIYDYRLTSFYPFKAFNIIKEWNLDVIHTQTEFGVGTFARVIGKQLDIPVVKKATHGGSYYPKITLTFKSQDNPDGFIEITRDFKNYNENCSGLKGKIKEGKKIPTQEYKESDIKLFLSQIEFRYIQSIDVNISEIIDTLTNDILDTRYNKARFSQKKKDYSWEKKPERP